MEHVVYMILHVVYMILHVLVYMMLHVVYMILHVVYMMSHAVCMMLHVLVYKILHVLVYKILHVLVYKILHVLVYMILVYNCGTTRTYTQTCTSPLLFPTPSTSSTSPTHKNKVPQATHMQAWIMPNCCVVSPSSVAGRAWKTHFGIAARGSRLERSWYTGNGH